MKKNAVFLLIIAIVMLATACSATPSAPRGGASATDAQDGAGEAPAAYQAAATGAPPSVSYESEPYPFEADGSSQNGYASQSESYLEIRENSRVSTDTNTLLTFSLKVDTASYGNVERYIKNGSLPPADAVKIEELINYFNYDADMPFSEHPFSIYTEVGPSPFDRNKHLAFVRVKARDVDRSGLPPSNLTFLIDTSGSMDSYDKLPLLKSAFRLLVENLNAQDRVSIVTYAGSSEVVLDGVSGAEKARILDAIDRLSAGGSTAGGKGIQTAYSLAEWHYMEGGNNRILLATDGDFNVGVSDVGELEALIANKRETGVYLSVLGFGTGNIRDDIMETLAKNGNGNYSYINSVSAAQKVLVDELTVNMFTIADDVKAQVEFNPANVRNYRLIGYENRRLSNEDFNDDRKDAGEIGAGADMVIMFEIELEDAVPVQALKYSAATPAPVPRNTGNFADELFEVRIRYKHPGEAQSNLMTVPARVGHITQTGSSDFNFASAAAAFGHLLRNSEYMDSVSIDDVIALADGSLGYDKGDYRKGFADLLRQYRGIR